MSEPKSSKNMSSKSLNQTKSSSSQAKEITPTSESKTGSRASASTAAKKPKKSPTDQTKKAKTEENSKTSKIAGKTKDEDKPASDEEKKHKKEVKHKARVENFAENLIKLFVPISFTMIFVMTVQTISITYKEEKMRVKAASFMPYDDPSNVGQTIANAAIFLVLIIVMTCLLLLCVYFDKLCILYGVLTLSIVLILFVLSGFFILKMIPLLNWTFDYISLCFLIYNYGVLGLVTLFWKGPLLVKQIYTCINCALSVLNLLLYLPGQTIWGLLVLLIIWDIVAVLTPCGPLKLLIELFDKKGKGAKDLPPGMVYGTFVYFMADKSVKTKDKDKSESKWDVSETGDEEVTVEDDDGAVYLGLGDFVFYSALIGKAVIETDVHFGAIDWHCIIGCYVAILIGLICTIVILLVFEVPLPALPISLLFGLVVFVATIFLITPFFDVLAIDITVI